MSPVYTALLLGVPVLLAYVESCSPPPCSQIIAQLDSVTRWCVAPLAKRSASTTAEWVMRCEATHGLLDSPPELRVYDVLVGTSPGYEQLASAETFWTTCQADRISHSARTAVYFGAVWDSSRGTCPYDYSVWVATYNAPSCWERNSTDTLSSRRLDERKVRYLRKDEMYQCTQCNITSKNTNFNHLNGMRTNKYVVTKYPRTKIFQFQSCNETNTNKLPILRILDHERFSCEDCRLWIKISEEDLIEYIDCDGEEISTPITSPPGGLLLRKCKKKWEDPDTSESEKEWGVWSTDSTEMESSSTEPVEPTSAGTNTGVNIQKSIDHTDIVEEAVSLLDPNNFDPNGIVSRMGPGDQGPATVLEWLDLVINASETLTPDKVSRSLKGFEMYTATDSVDAHGERPVQERRDSATLVVARGVVGALVSDSGTNVTLLKDQEAAWSPQMLSDMEASAGVLLPVDNGGVASRIAVTVFRRDRLRAAFRQPGVHINSDVIGVEVMKSDPLYVDILLKPKVTGVRRRCGFWDLDNEVWKFNGCSIHHVGQVSDVCRCWHLTHFAQLVTDGDLQWGRHATTLEVLSLAGVAASLLGAAGLAVTAVLVRSWRRKPGTLVLLQLGGAVCLRDLLFALVTVDGFRPTWLWGPENLNTCRALGVALHYALLTAAAWTTTSAILQLLRLSTVAGVQASVPHVVLLCSAASWLAPLVPVLAVVLTQGVPAGYPQLDDSATDYLCYPRGVTLYLAVVLPVSLLTAINVVIFLYLLLTVLFPPKLDQPLFQGKKHGSMQLRRRATTAAMLFFLLGLPWVLGPPARLIALAYLFCIVATPQGLALFVFFVLCNGRLRSSLWSVVRQPLASFPGVSDNRRPSGATSVTNTDDGPSQRFQLEQPLTKRKAARPLR